MIDSGKQPHQTQPLTLPVLPAPTFRRGQSLAAKIIPAESGFLHGFLFQKTSQNNKNYFAVRAGAGTSRHRVSVRLALHARPHSSKNSDGRNHRDDGVGASPISAPSHNSPIPSRPNPQQFAVCM